MALRMADRGLPDNTTEHSTFCRTFWQGLIGGDSYLRSQVGGDNCCTCHAYRQGREDAAYAVETVTEYPMKYKGASQSFLMRSETIRAARGQ